jgi:hypothetical protein
MAVLMLAGRMSLDPYRFLHEAKTGMRIIILYALLNSWPEICSLTGILEKLNNKFSDARGKRRCQQPMNDLTLRRPRARESICLGLTQE